MTIKEAQLAVDQWIKTYGVRYFSELTNMAVLTEEVGELARVMARKYGDQSWKASDPRKEDNGQAALGNTGTRVSRKARKTTLAKRWLTCFGW